MFNFFNQECNDERPAPPRLLKSKKETMKNVQSCDTMKPSKIINTGENINMAQKWFNVNWKDQIAPLLTLAQSENWSNALYPDNGILINYMAHTVQKLQKDKSIIYADTYAILNTGLFTEYYEPIYALHTDKGVSYGTSYDLSEYTLPLRANYFNKPEDLIFDWNYEIYVQYDHILGDKENIKRLPANITNPNTTLRGAIEISKSMVMSNYKLAVPQFYDNKIQLLLPLYLTEQPKPDLVLVITKKENLYLAHTCITLDMAYNNARLIARPDNTWLTN